MARPLTSDGIPCMLMRGGSSKGAYFLADDLPHDPEERDRLLLAVMGTPDPRQIDGLGGAHPLTSKVAIVGPSRRADVDYLFLQVGVDRATVTDRQNCGNLLAGVGPFAVERGLVAPSDGETTIAIHMRNGDASAAASFEVRGGRPVYEGSTAVAGVPGTAAPIHISFEAGATSPLPTGRVRDTVEGVESTLVDTGMPVVVVPAAAMGIAGTETPEELEADADLGRRLEAIRLAAGPLMGLGDVADLSVPKLTIVAPPVADGDLLTRTFIPHRCHQAIGVFGAVSVATATHVPGTVPAELLGTGPADDQVVLEHPTGTFAATVEVELSEGGPTLVRAGIVRTARKLIDGTVFPRPY